MELIYVAEVKDKMVTVDSLSALHEYNKNTYATKTDIDSIATTSGGGAEYIVTVPSIKSLTGGVGFTMIPHESFTTGTVKLNVNGTGSKDIYHRTSNGSITGGMSLSANMPVHVVWSPTGCWIVDDCMTTLLQSTVSGVLPIMNGGTGAAIGYMALQNLLASGITILSPHQYGDTLPPAGNAGRIFFKKLSE